jgi:AbrB family looped-hinge helix DNA binding protein
MRVKISDRGRVVIPAELRNKYGLKPGTNVHFVDYGGVVSIVPASLDSVAHAAGMLKGQASLTRELLKEHQKDLRR